MRSEDLARAFPVEHEGVRLECTGALDGPDGPSLRLQLLLLDDDGGVVDVKEQDLPIAALEADVNELAARVAQRLRAPELDVDALMPAQLVVPPFRRVALPPTGASEPERRSELLMGLIAQANAPGFFGWSERVDVWPRAARTLYFSFILDSKAHGGLERYLQQADFFEVAGVLGALDELGCPALRSRVAQGITLAAQEGAEFAMQTDDEWIEAHGLPVPAADGSPWQQIDGDQEGGSGWLLRNELAPKLDAYFRAHEAELVA